MGKTARLSRNLVPARVKTLNIDDADAIFPKLSTLYESLPDKKEWSAVYDTITTTSSRKIIDVSVEYRIESCGFETSVRIRV